MLPSHVKLISTSTTVIHLSAPISAFWAALHSTAAAYSCYTQLVPEGPHHPLSTAADEVHPSKAAIEAVQGLILALPRPWEDFNSCLWFLHCHTRLPQGLKMSCEGLTWYCAGLMRSHKGPSCCLASLGLISSRRKKMAKVGWYCSI